MSATPRPLARRGLLAAALTLALGAAALDAVQDRPALEFGQGEAGVVARVEATTLAHRIREGSRVRIVDVRDSASFAAFTLPGAERPVDSLRAGAAFARGDTIVVLAADDILADREATRLEAGDGVTVLVLRGGVTAWISEVLAPRAPPAPASGEALARYRDAVALSNWFGGLPTGIEVPSTPDSAVGVPVRRDRAVYHGC